MEREIIKKSAKQVFVDFSATPLPRVRVTNSDKPNPNLAEEWTLVTEFKEIDEILSAKDSEQWKTYKEQHGFNDRRKKRW